MGTEDKKQLWMTMCREAYEGAGFVVKEYQGFPMVEIPESFEDTVSFLDFKPPFSVSVRIYSEGAILVPAP